MTDKIFIQLLKNAFKPYFIPNKDGKTESVLNDIEGIVKLYKKEILTKKSKKNDTKLYHYENENH